MTYAWHSRHPGAAFTHQQRAAAADLQAPRSTTIDYADLMQRRRRQPGACPPLLLAPMEGLADAPFRKALVAAAGGFDEACTEFIRVPNAASHPRKMVRGVTARWGGPALARPRGPERGARPSCLCSATQRPPPLPPPLLCRCSYDPQELGPVPLAAQVMGSNRELLAATAARLVHVLGAPRLDLNCGCPANTVTGAPAQQLPPRQAAAKLPSSRQAAQQPPSCPAAAKLLPSSCQAAQQPPSCCPAAAKLPSSCSCPAAAAPAGPTARSHGPRRCPVQGQRSSPRLPTPVAAAGTKRQARQLPSRALPCRVARRQDGRVVAAQGPQLRV
jgi:hypothetical protein